MELKTCNKENKKKVELAVDLRLLPNLTIAIQYSDSNNNERN
jgi:hypothetical protein